MRRRISLYIGDRKADLDNDSFILFNYTMDDLRNPTIVKNSYSQQVSLKGTPANNAIFGHYYRLDRNTAADVYGGASYDASARTPFSIYDEMGEVLESGYCRLDNVKRNGEDITYRVSLFGGLGSFFYALSYSGSGEKMTLADLDYLGTGDPENELNFTIFNNTVTNAWARLISSPASIQQMWDVINFCPAYNGYPDGDFSADKAVVTPSQVFLTAPQDDYDVFDSKCLVNLSQKHTEWEMKDLRSYLQRPVLSMKAFLAAVAVQENNGGYSFDYSTVPSAVYDKLWKTLPSLPSLGSFLQQYTNNVTLTPSTSSTYTTDEVIATIAASYGTATLDTVKISATYNIQFYKASGNPSQDLRLYSRDTHDPLKWLYYKTVIFAQLVAYDSSNNPIGGSPVRCFAPGREDVQALAERAGLHPVYSRAGYEALSVNAIAKNNGNYYELGNQVFQMEAAAPASYKLHLMSYNMVTYESNSIFHGDEPGPVIATQRTPMFFNSAGSIYQPQGAKAVLSSADPTISVGEKLRSYARITKKMLLSGSATPADYLIGFAKMHGLVFTYDRSTKSVSMLTRNDFYDSSDIIDLTARVDRSKGVEVTPLAFTAKWYDLDLDMVGGAFANEYKGVYGQNYGTQRIDTGYAFDCAAVDLLDGIAYKNAVSVLESGRYFDYYTVVVNDTTYPFPSVFKDFGNTYTLWNSDGEAQDFPCPLIPSEASHLIFNQDFPGYDVANSWKLQLHDIDGKPVDGQDVLVYYRGYNISSYFRISDDTAVMLSINDGKACWDMTPGPSAGIYIPLFSRYQQYHPASPEYEVGRSLDFGTPKQLDIPRIVFKGRIGTGSLCTLYERAWKAYINDRYDLDTKVMKCKVDLSGLQVGQDLLRRFFYYDGSYWTLNKIINHSLTTWDPTECEFVQVKDITAYTNGQDL